MQKLIYSLLFLLFTALTHAQVTYEIDSSFEYRSNTDEVLLHGESILTTEVNLRVQDTTTNGFILLKPQVNPIITINAQGDYKNVEIFSNNPNSEGGAIILSDRANGRGDVLKLVTDFNNTGDARVITDEIQINGGSDLAELFDITTDKAITHPGLLVSLDPHAPGKLMITQDAYDKKIAGVISGANGVKPGILMGQDNTIAHGDELVTLSGRTYVQCNTSNGAIRIGDLITSSDTPGEAMRASSKKKSKGAVIGKAMTELESGSGFILVLINLQ